MWKKVSVDRESGAPGIITHDKYLIETPKGYKVEKTTFIEKCDIICHHEAISGDKVNNVVLNSDISLMTQGLNVRMIHLETNKQIGFICTVPHTISIESKEILTCVTTFLALNKEHRKAKISEYLINKLMSFGASKGVNCGYYFSSKPRSRSAVTLKGWYRPLNVIEADKNGYNIILPKSASKISNKVMAAIKFYQCESKVSSSKTTMVDINNLYKRSVSLSMNDFEFTVLNKGTLKWMTYSDDDGGIVTCVTPYEILQPGGNVIKVCLLVYCETLYREDYDLMKMKDYLDSLFFDLSVDGYYAVHGCNMGPLDYNSSHMFGPLLAIESSTTFLDFYNLRTLRSKKIRDVNLLYM
jgi:hypothetical protein